MNRDNKIKSTVNGLDTSVYKVDEFILRTPLSYSIQGYSFALTLESKFITLGLRVKTKVYSCIE